MLNNIRQRLRRETVRIIGRLKTLEFSADERSAFTNDGNIASTRDTDTPVVQGVVAHQPTDVAGQCDSCDSYFTASMASRCERCKRMICSPCAKRWGDNKMTVCPVCLTYLKRRQRVLIAKKLLIHPFIEPLK